MKKIKGSNRIQSGFTGLAGITWYGMPIRWARRMFLSRQYTLYRVHPRMIATAIIGANMMDEHVKGVERLEERWVERGRRGRRRVHCMNQLSS
jgi:hypothetical protein